jgi:hypothetical protein
MNLTLWLEADSGFYLIVQKRPGQYQVRSHLRSCLESLRRIAEIEGEIVESAQSAMRYRITLSSAQVFQMLARIDRYEHESLMQQRGETVRHEAAMPLEPRGFAEIALA